VHKDEFEPGSREHSRHITPDQILGVMAAPMKPDDRCGVFLARFNHSAPETRPSLYLSNSTFSPVYFSDLICRLIFSISTRSCFLIVLADSAR
jgi:hypothetical protein